MGRPYSLGRRQAEVERNRSGILAAARALVAEHGPEASMGRVAQKAGVSRITVYNQFGSKAGLLEALSAGLAPGPRGLPSPAVATDPGDELRRRIEQACAAWAEDPILQRRLSARFGDVEASSLDHGLAERLAAHDRLRPGCSIREAEDVIGVLTSFPVFDRLHKGGRRSPSAVAEILHRMASVVITPPPAV